MSLFSSRDARIAAMQNAYTAQQTQQQIAALLGQSQGASTNALTDARGQQLSALSQGYGAANSAYDRASALYEPYASQGLDAWNLQGDIAGLHGQEGHDRALAAFQTSPGYQWQVDQANDQVARGAAASGQLISGNTLTEMQNRASQLANQEYGAFDQRVGRMANVGYQATGAQADIGLGQGKLAYGYGGDQSSVYGDTAARLSGVYGTTAGQQASALSNLGQQLIGANNQVDKAAQDADANRISLLSGLLGLGAKAAAFPVKGGGSLGGDFIASRFA